jgi:ABC-2 type transport system ATP-binding protein
MTALSDTKIGTSYTTTTSDYSRAFVIETFNLTKKYGDVEAVRGLDLQVERGSIYALLGPNGAGKTTAISMLTTLIRPTSGQARVAGFDVVTQSDEVRRHIGVTFQETVLDKNLSGRVALDLHGRLYQMPRSQIKARIQELVQLVELTDAIDRPTKTYSGGMKRRLELARGLMTRPDILFLDEPTQGLDPQNRENIWLYIEQMRREQGLTILVTTHYMDEAEKLADHVGIIDAGKIVASGTPRDLVGAMGSDVVSIQGGAAQEQGVAEKFVQMLRSAAFVAWAEVHSEEKSVIVGLKAEAGRSLKPIIDLAEQSSYEVADVSISRPSLNDVFLKYTGRRLRD